MSCTAKLPIYGFFVAAFFPGSGWWMITALYLLGIVTGILSAIFLKKTLFKGDAVPLVMELPNYRMPGAKNVGHLIWDKSKDFLQRAFSVILIATIAVWFLQSFDFGFNMVDDAQKSILAAVAGALAPVLGPVGLGDWRIVTALISGFMAKDSVVAMMNMLFAGGVAAALTTLEAASMLVFSLLYTPCVAAVAAIRRELGGGWALYVVLCQCGIAWVMALLVRIIGLALGMN
jgi:ferrous iron transport protein B